MGRIIIIRIELCRETITVYLIIATIITTSAPVIIRQSPDFPRDYPSGIQRPPGAKNSGPYIGNTSIGCIVE